MHKRLITLAAAAILLLAPAWAQDQKPPDDTSAMHDMPGMGNDGSAHAMQSMEGHHMDMGPHMKMTALRDPKPGDEEKAAQVVEAARKAADKYKDYRAALADGYKIFLPNLPQKQYHFTNYWYGFEAGMHFNPEHPTSLLYEKNGDDYKLIGVMYTARKTATEDELNTRIPLSVAQWHAHINMCVPPDDQKRDMWGPHPKFGLAGSIATKEDCTAAGGKFVPQIFGWMVHVYPFEQKPEDIWSVERQAHDHNHGD
jgi:predicted secreted protein